VQFAALMSGVAGALVGGDAKSVNLAAATGANSAANNYLLHPELENKKRLLAKDPKDLTPREADLLAEYKIRDLERNAELDKCVGKITPECGQIVKDAAQAYKELGDYANQKINLYIKTGNLEYKLDAETALAERKEAGAGLKSFYLEASKGDDSVTKQPITINGYRQTLITPNSTAYGSYLQIQADENQVLGPTFTGAPTVNPSNKAMGRLTEPSTPLPRGANEIPDFVVRTDNNFESPVNDKGAPKARIDAGGDLVPANLEGAGDIKSHIRGGNSKDSPHISTTDPSQAETTKIFGSDKRTIDTTGLQSGIDSGKVTGTEIIPTGAVRQNLESRINDLEAAYTANPTQRNADRIVDAKRDLQNAIDAGEVLIKGTVPAEYIRPVYPLGTAPPTIPILPTLPKNAQTEEKKNVE
jgi:hypothetical protein